MKKLNILNDEEIEVINEHVTENQTVINLKQRNRADSSNVVVNNNFIDNKDDKKIEIESIPPPPPPKKSLYVRNMPRERAATHQPRVPEVISTPVSQPKRVSVISIGSSHKRHTISSSSFSSTIETPKAPQSTTSGVEMSLLEIYYSEETYVSHLETFSCCFLKPILQSANDETFTPHLKITQEDCIVLFSNIEHLCDLSQRFLNDIKVISMKIHFN